MLLPHPVGVQLESQPSSSSVLPSSQSLGAGDDVVAAGGGDGAVGCRSRRCSWRCASSRVSPAWEAVAAGAADAVGAGAVGAAGVPSIWIGLEQCDAAVVLQRR
ncbi:MAG: hypothetical protein R3F14_25630 [Polyangiaceae bacterium]